MNEWISFISVLFLLTFIDWWPDGTDRKVRWILRGVFVAMVVVTLLSGCEGNYLDWNGKPIRQTEEERINHIAGDGQSSQTKCIQKVSERYHRCAGGCYDADGVKDQSCEDGCLHDRSERETQCHEL